jgi:hypothetical protein
VIERLLENWLDSASERSYQPVFVQMLSGLGYRVVHSTRHNVLEFGKDVLAVDGDGIGCAYQLKGNPGGKLGLTQFRNEIQVQLVQLMSQPVIYPGFPPDAHRAYLVSNGYFEEEVQRAVDDLNRGPYPSKVTLISRGEMLAWANQLGASLWPSELGDTRVLLELFLADPKDLLPLDKLARLIGAVLETETDRIHGVGEPELHRKITSAALLTGIATAPFAERKNHLATASAWAFLAVSVIAALGKYDRPLRGAALQTVRLAEVSCLDALAALWAEVRERKHLVEGNAMADAEVFHWRHIVLLSAMSVLATANDDAAFLEANEADSLKAWLTRSHGQVQLWGEAAAVQLIPWLIYLRKHNATIQPDLEICGLADAVIRMNQRKSQAALASPYYSFEEVTRPRLGLGGKQQPIEETFAGASYTAEALLHLAARTNIKSRCKQLWPEFSRLANRRFVVASPWHYCLLKVDAGQDETHIYPATYKWAQLRADATATENPTGVPELLMARPWLLAFWWMIAPHRFTTASCRAYVNVQIPGWGT